MKAEEIRELSDEEIRSRIAELQEERFRLRFRSATEVVDQPLRFRTIRRDIARLMTILRERQLAAADGEGGRRGRRTRAERRAGR